MEVGERAGPGEADAVDRFRCSDPERAKDEPGDQPAAIHPVGAHDVDTARRFRMLTAGSVGGVGDHLVEAEGRR